jgi:hypothetical protein
MSEPSVFLAVGPGGGPGEVVQLRVNHESAIELAGLMKGEGVFEGFAVQESADIPALAAIVASIAGGLGGVAAVLNAFFKRHQHRAVLFERDGTRYELKGMSQADMKELIDRTLDRARQDQRGIELLYRLPGSDDEGAQ